MLLVLLDRKIQPQSPSSNFIVGRPKAARLFRLLWFFGSFTSGVKLCAVTLVRKMQNR